MNNRREQQCAPALFNDLYWNADFYGSLDHVGRAVAAGKGNDKGRVQAGLARPACGRDVVFLSLQEQYCLYTFTWLYFLQNEIQKLRGKISTHDAVRPQIKSQPPLYSPQ